MKKIMTKSTIILFAIVLLAFFLRTFRITTNPPSLSWDEVSIGYNAYSILKTGKDEHGRFFPLDTFVGYGDYKPPLSIYITVPFVAVFGLNELAVRLPSALFGTLTVLMTYFLVKELIRYGLRNNESDVLRVTRYGLKKKDQEQKNSSPVTRNTLTIMPLLSAFLLAISPWHINLSRAGFEANIALFLVVVGVYGIFRAVRSPNVWRVALLPFVGAIYTFNSSRYFVAFLSFGCFILFFQDIRKHYKQVLIGCFIAGVMLLPIVPHLISKEARLRFTEVNIFSDANVVLVANKRIEQTGNAWWAKIIYNRRIGYAQSYISHYLDHFQPEYLFIKGDGNPKFSIQDVGQLYSIEAPFLVIGIFALLIANPSIGLFLLYWLCMAIVPAAVARETPHALRTLNSLPTWQIFVAYGIIQCINYELRITNWKVIRYSLFAIFLLCYSFSVMYYLHSYYIHYPKEFSGEWQYGYKQALAYVHPLEQSYDAIYMAESIGRPYMYTLFYNHVDPNVFFSSKTDSFDTAGFYHVYGFANYHFVKDMPTVCSGTCLFIADAGSQIKEFKKLETIYLLNGKPILEIYEK